MTLRHVGVVLHHSLTADGSTVSWPAIRAWHIREKGFKDCGYHLGVELAGSEFEALVGRPLDIVGAACPQDGMNSKPTIQVCLVGNFNETPPPNEQMVVLVDRILKPYSRIFGFPLDLEHVTFHRDHARDGRTCPGTAFTKQFLQGYLGGIV